jgi:hypothetical protein
VGSPLLAALAEIAPDYVHPETGQALEQIASRMSTDGLKRHSDAVIAITEKRERKNNWLT